MANQFLDSSLIVNEALRVLENNLSFTKGVSRKYENKFGNAGAKVGDTINVRKPQRFLGATGRNLAIEDLKDSTIPVALTTQFQVAMEVTSDDFLLSIDMFTERYLSSAISTIANKIDKDGLTLANKIPAAVGTGSTLAKDLKTYLEAGAILDNAGVPKDDGRAVVVGAYTQAGLVDNLKSLFQDVTEVSRQYREGTMGRTAGFKWSMDQNVVSHTFGTGVQETDLTVSGAGQSGTTLNIAGLTGTLKAGDTFTIAGVYSINPISKDSTGKLQSFVVLADVAAAGTALSIAPEIVVGTAYATVSAAPANAAVISFVGVAGTTVEIGLAYHKDAFTLVCADLPLPKGTDDAARVSDDQLGLSIRMIRDYDINTDKFICRLDVLYGWAVMRPECAVKVFSNPSAF